MTTLRLVCATTVALLAAAVPAQADNQLIPASGGVTVRSDDAGIANAYEIADVGTDRVRFHEPKDPKGWSFPADCTPSKTENGVITEVTCPRSMLAKGIGVEPGPGEDSLTYSVSGVSVSVGGADGADKLISTGDTSDFISGDQGNDLVDGGPGDDELRGEIGNDTVKGGAGNDKIFGDAGADVLEGGAGDDSFQAAEGTADKIDCGEGNDTVVADNLDEVVGCENVTREAVGNAPAPTEVDDGKRPTCKLGGYTRQRINRRTRVLRVYVVASEKANVAVTGYMDVDGLNQALPPAKGKVKVGGGGVEVKIRLSAKLHRAVLKDLRRRRTPRAFITASVVDSAGNTSKPRTLKIRIRN